MKFFHELLSSPIFFSEGVHNVLVIEHPGSMSSIIEGIIHHVETGGGEIHLDDESGREMKAELIIDPFSIDMNSKRLRSKIESCVRDELDSEDYYLRIRESESILKTVVAEVSDSLPFEISLDLELDSTKILKMIELSLIDDSESLMQRVLNHIRMSKIFLKTDLFIIVNLTSYVDTEVLSELYQMLDYLKVDCLLIENKTHPSVMGEKVVLYDKDMCEIRYDTEKEIYSNRI